MSSYSFDPVSGIMEITFPRQRMGHRRWHSKVLVLASSIAIFGVSYLVEDVYDIPGLGLDHLGVFFAAVLVIYPLNFLLSKTHVENLVLKKQCEGAASQIRFTEEAIIFCPGERFEVRLARSDVISLVRDPKKKSQRGKDDIWEESGKRLIGIKRITGRRKLLKGHRSEWILDKCIVASDMQHIFMLIAAWGQSYEQMLQTVVQSGMFYPGNRYSSSGFGQHCFWLSQDIIGLCEKADAHLQPIRINALTTPTNEREITLEYQELHNSEEPRRLLNLFRDMRLLPEYALYFEVDEQKKDVVAIFRPERDMKKPPQTFSDICEALLHSERLLYFLDWITFDQDHFKPIRESGHLPRSEAQMAAKGIFGLQALDICPKLKMALNEKMFERHGCKYLPRPDIFIDGPSVFGEPSQEGTGSSA